MRTILAIDGGNSKTDVAFVTEDGEVLARARAGGFTPQSSGVAAAIDVVGEAVRLALGPDAAPPYADLVSAYVAGADLPQEEEALAAEISRRGYGREVRVGNDTFSLLRAGASQGWGVAVVCGAGVNAAGIGPDGSIARLPSLGRISGDWGGGQHLGEEVLWHAIRAEDGRGEDTELVGVVLRQFDAERVEDVTVGLHLGYIPPSRLHELVPPLFAVSAAGDPVARAIVDRMADEVCALGTAMLKRLDLLGTPAEVVLGGGVLTARDPGLTAAVEARYAERAPHAKLVVVDAPPIAGAALLGLDHLGAPPGADSRLRAAFG
ncbi:ATPase [Bailinhaonella thermotolerans]|uniref:ATPase n=1 Tax=Bailinhaonella thermotolerans TaxID=1070861 RepID=A0A3A4B6A9_9ACTN|nr:ATPase [Bailinhaonella thermotolerans]